MNKPPDKSALGGSESAAGSPRKTSGVPLSRFATREIQAEPRRLPLRGPPYRTWPRQLPVSHR